MFYLNESVNIEWLATKLGLTLNGQPGFELVGVSTINDPGKQCLLFSKNPIAVPEGTVVIGPSECEGGALLVSENPRLDFIRALEVLQQSIGFRVSNVHSVIPESVERGENVVIENGVVIGENTVIAHNVVIKSGTTIGSNCLIRENTTIGSDGFGFERTEDGTPVKFIHLGGVEIGNNVEIGANTSVSKGTLSNTIIEDHVKIDNLVHVAHNCRVRKGAFVIASTVLCGGVDVGENAWIAPNATISQKITLGEGSFVGLGAVVTKDVEEHQVVAGNPARKLRKTS